MKYFPLFFLLIFIPFISSCQNSKHIAYADIAHVESLYLDQQFTSASPIHIETEQEIFMLDDDMLALVENKLMNYKSSKKKAMLLLEHIFSQDNIALSYSSHANVTAREAFKNKTANCMSLTIMAYALAKKARLNVKFQEVDIPEYWIRNGQYNLLTGHINLLIEAHDHLERTIIFGSSAIQIDFDPLVLKKQFPRRIIKKNTVVAMFYNNKGGQALVNGNYSVAYQYLKEATVTDANFSAAWGNLAVLYRITNNLHVAEKTYHHAINLNPNNLTALSNLAILLRTTQNHVEADKLEQILAPKRNRNPYYHAVLADEAFYKSDFEQALRHYKKAIRLDNKVHEFYFGLAKVYFQMNKFNAAKKSMRTALKLNKEKSTEFEYIAKLNFLNVQSTLNEKNKS